MRRIFCLVLLMPVLLLHGCSSAPASEALTGLIFDRGSGSVWGNQLYIHISQDRIHTLRYIPDNSAQLQEVEQIPITPDQWGAIRQELSRLKLEQEKRLLLQWLFPKQDGGEYRRLTLVYGQKEITYRWPADGEQLEALLEQLVREVTR